MFDFIFRAAADLGMSAMKNKRLYINSVQIIGMDCQSCKVHEMKMKDSSVHVFCTVDLEVSAQGCNNSYYSAGLRYDTLVTSGNSQDFGYQATAVVVGCMVKLVFNMVTETMESFSFVSPLNFYVTEVVVHNAGGDMPGVQQAVDSKLPAFQNKFNEALGRTMVEKIKHTMSNNCQSLNTPMRLAVERFLGVLHPVTKKFLKVAPIKRGAGRRGFVGLVLKGFTDCANFFDGFHGATQTFLNGLICSSKFQKKFVNGQDFPQSGIEVHM